MALSSTETIFSSDAALAADPYNLGTGLLEDNIASILLPQVQCGWCSAGGGGRWTVCCGRGGRRTWPLRPLHNARSGQWRAAADTAVGRTVFGMRLHARDVYRPPALAVGQMTSARQGVELLGQYIQTLGSAEGYGIQFADNEEAW